MLREIGAARPPAVVAVAACVALAGCDLSGEEEPPTPVAAGELAGHVPQDAFFYAEGVVRPDADLSEAIDASLEGLGADTDETDAIGPAVLERVAEGLALPGADELDYEDDVEPWLGQRAVVFASVPRAALQLARAGGAGRKDLAEAVRAASVIAVSDADEARDVFERVLPDDALESRAGSDLFFETDDDALALAGDRLVIGRKELVQAVLGTRSRESLARRGWFRAGIDSVSEQDAVAFMLGETRQAFALQVLAEGGPVPPELTDPRLLADAGLNTDIPTTVELLAEGGQPAVEITYGLERRPRLRAARSLVETLPGDAWAAVGDPVLLPFLADMFTAGVEIGIEAELGALTPREQRRGLVQGLGYDVVRALRSLGDVAALYARGDGLREAVAVLVATSDASDPAAQPIDAARFLIASLAPRSGVALERAPGRPAGRLSADPPGTFLPLSAVQRPRALEVSLGRGRHQGFAGETIGTTGGLAEVGNRLGAPWQPLGYVDLRRLTAFAAAVSGEPAPDLDAPPEPTIDIGGAYEDGIFTLRLEPSRQGE